MLKENIRTMIKEDIEECKEKSKHVMDSYDLYVRLCAKYSCLDKNFNNGIHSFGKIATNQGLDYRNELQQIQEILNMYLLLDEIPIQYIENVAEGVNIGMYANTIKNKGNIGYGNSQSSKLEMLITKKEKTTNKETESLWKFLWKRLFHNKEKN